MQAGSQEELPSQAKTLGDPPPIIVRSADANSTIKVATTSARLSFDVLIEEVANVEVPDLRVAVWPLTGSAAGQVDIGMCPDERSAKLDQAQFAPLFRRQLVKVCLDAALPSIGTYGATLSLNYFGADNKPRRDNYTVAIERRAPPTTFAMTALPVGPVESPFLLFSPADLLGDRADTEADEWSVPVRVTISEIAGQEARVSLPRVVEFSQFGANDTIVQSDPGRVKVRNEDGVELRPSERLVLTPKSSQVIDLIPQKLLGPGQYRAKVETSTAEGAMAQTEVDIRVRHG